MTLITKHFNKFTLIYTVATIALINLLATPATARTKIKSLRNRPIKIPKISIAQKQEPSLKLHSQLTKSVLAVEGKTQSTNQSHPLLPATQTTIPVKDRSLVAQAIRGRASWYGPGFHGRPTASGERFNQNAFTAAHPYLAFGTRVRVTNMNNGKSVIVRINDRGPFVAGRIIDLSKAAARSIGLMRSGVAPVRVNIVGQ